MKENTPLFTLLSQNPYACTHHENAWGGFSIQDLFFLAKASTIKWNQQLIAKISEANLIMQTLLQNS